MLDTVTRKSKPNGHIPVSQLLGRFVIEDDVPLPPQSRGTGGGRPRLYPINQLKVGQSFFVPAGNKTPLKLQAVLTAVVGGYRRRHAPRSKFATRQEGNGVRVWRIK